MNTIIWNIRGANNAEFKRHCQAVINIYIPSLLAILETRMGDHKALAEILGYNSQIQFPASENSGGIVIVWDSSSMGI